MLNVMTSLYVALCMRFGEFKREERGAVDIVAIVVMIGIAIVFAVLFRNQIGGLLDTLFANIEQGATQATQPAG